MDQVQKLLPTFDDKAEALHYWQSKLEQGLPELQLPCDFSQPSPDRGGTTFRSVVPREIKENLKKLAKAQQASLFMVLFSAFNLLLSRLTGQEEILCRVPAAGRDQPELHPVIGYFVNSIMVKNQVKNGENFVDLLHRVVENTLDAFQYQWYPFEQVVEDLHREMPVTKVSFNMLSMRESEAGTDLEELEAFSSEDITEAKFPLIIRLTEYRNGIEIGWDGQKALFKPSSLERMARQYIELLKTISH